LASAYYFDSTTYWSAGDEDSHFRWLDAIGCVQAVRGQGRRLFLEIEKEQVSDEDLQELKAVYRRYGGDLSQLDGLRAGHEG